MMMEHFWGAVNTPTDMWPLNGSYEVFTAENCKLIQDPAVVEVVDAIPYHIGHCYTNAENVTEALQAVGYTATQYCGWMFVGEQWPIHHSWTVLNGDHVVDLADEFAVLHTNHKQFDEAEGIQATREKLVEFSRWIRQFSNSQRTMPFGIPAGNLLYIGCPCSREEGLNIHNKLAKENPAHPCFERVVDGHGRTKMQQMLQDAGIMP